MRTAPKEPTLIEDIGALADLYVGVFRLMSRRWDPRTPKKSVPTLPEEMWLPPLPEWREEREPAQVSRRN
jgi:hypothetical protein